ncbi:MAG: transporter substrate-binding protein [Polaromonas sp.]|jgi:tripartite-type tricarboxylate transporter receptor subunit TctC|nr:transporter substrate-binding protein [Polaromonas sp.]MDB5940211.1 transporter substrate-binding protein [Polaromonas sp.]
MTMKQLVLAACTVVCALATNAQTAAYPSRPIKIIVPYAPGGSTDIVVREFATLASPKLGQPIVIDNKGGAGATMGARDIANAKPDGYTLAILPSPVFRMPHIQNVGYDPLKDFSYINMLSGYVLGVAVKSSSPYKTWDDFVAGTRANPQGVTYGTASIGSASNVIMENIGAHYGLKLTHVPYQGESGVVQAVLGDFVGAYAGSSTVAPMVKAGQMRMLVTWGSKRSALYPGVPTLHELNPKIEPNSSPFGIAGPKGLPVEVMSKLNAVFKEVIESPEFRATLERYGQEPVYMNSTDYAAFARKAFAEEAEIVKKLGLKAN